MADITKAQVACAKGRRGVVTTRMLASVTSVREARVALAEGVDVVDLKDPAAGTLGALPAAVVRDAVAAVGGACVLSATVGDLAPEPAPIRDAVARMAATGVDYVKVGLFAGNGQAACVAGLRPVCAAGAGLVVVLFADQEPDFSLLPLIADAGCAGVMLDTAEKSRGGLRDYLDRATLRSFVSPAHALGLFAGLAGSLGPDDVPELVALGPDLLGFRGALCVQAARTETLDPAAVRRIRALIPAHGPRPEAVALLAEAG